MASPALYSEPVTSQDDDSTVVRKLAVALGAQVSANDDDSAVLRKACAAAQGTVYPPA